MTLSNKQRELCSELGLSERLIEDIVSAASEPGLPCPDCEQSACTCEIDEFPFGMESTQNPAAPAAGVDSRADARQKEAEREKKLKDKMQNIVQQDMHGKYNSKSDKVTLFPSTDAQI